MKAIVLALLVIMAGNVFGYAIHSAQAVDIAMPAPKPVPVPTPTVSSGSTEASVVVGPWQSLWQMHYKWNPATKTWEKRVFVPTPSRGRYDFATKTWVK